MKIIACVAPFVALLLAPATARAATAPLNAAGLAGWAIAVLAGACAALAWWLARRRASRVTVAHATVTAQLQTLLASAPGAFYACDGAREWCSDRLSTVLDIAEGGIVTLADLAPAFTSEHFAQLRDRIGELRDGGTAFEIALPSADATRWLTIHGATTGEMGSDAAVVWFRDTTQQVSEQQRTRDE